MGMEKQREWKMGSVVGGSVTVGLVTPGARQDVHSRGGWAFPTLPKSKLF